MKSPFKLLAYTITSCVLLASATPAAFAENAVTTPAPVPVTAVPISAPIHAVPISAKLDSGAVQVVAKAVYEENDLYKVELSIPVMQELKDEKYQAQFNDIVESNTMKGLEDLKKQAAEGADAAKQNGYPYHRYEMIMKYEVKSDGSEADANRVSLKVTTYTYTGGAHGNQRMDTYNFTNEKVANRVQLQDIFGADYKVFLDDQISAKIAENPDNYLKGAFKGVRDATNFYVEKGNGVIVFQPYEIAPYVAGAPEFSFPIQQGTSGGSVSSRPLQLNVNGQSLGTVEAAVYMNGVQVQMVPLRVIAETLGFKVQWNEEQRSAELSKGAQWTSVTPDKNYYIYNKMAPITLSAAPKIKEDGKMYVPLTFFSDILKAQVTTENGTITIQ